MTDAPTNEAMERARELLAVAVDDVSAWTAAHIRRGDNELAVGIPEALRAIVAALSVDRFLGGFYAIVSVSRDGKLVQVEHKFDADWQDVLCAHQALRDWSIARIAGQDDCPYKPAGH